MATIAMTIRDYKKTLETEKRAVLVEFWAGWCGPCSMLAPILEEISAELEDRLVVAKVDVDANPQMASQFGVMSIPTMILFVDGVQAHSFVGAMGKDDLVAEFIDFIPELPAQE